MLAETDLANGVIRSPYSFDIPHAFIFNESEFREPVFCGPYMEIVKHFARANHYQLLLDPVESLPKKAVLEQDIVAGLYNLSLHGVTIRPEKVSDFSNATRHSYPLEMMTNCVMVPLAPELPKWMYMVWPLGRYIWTCLFLGTFYVALLLKYVHWREPGNATQSFTRNVLHAMALLMFSPNMNMTVKLKHASLRVITFYTLLFILGFILTNYHLSHMTAFDMKPVFLRPIDTWSDLIHSKLRIVIHDSLLEELRWLPDYQNLLASPSRSYAYVVTQDAWLFYNRQQRHLIQPYFHLTKVCFGGLFNALPMDYNASFAETLDRFILSAWQAGLWNYWEEIAFRYAKSAGYAKVFLDTYPVEPLNLEFFNTAWIVLSLGLPISSVVYFLELFIHRRREIRPQYDQFECYDY
ncbi:uncharacterized protein LOC108094822 [Drosophila ficusphila]|uniref:uncharacterized protein LOC108094822 n=1 Tax=Drosophila ficusphila TaxID=30025 RepID=UPI0007E88FFD|nr:uncharacterized protein LOC108094822 [Drosophila ficusphila]